MQQQSSAKEYIGQELHHELTAGEKTKERQKDESSAKDIGQYAFGFTIPGACCSLYQVLI